MKPEVKLGLGAAAVLLVVLGGAYFFVPAEPKPVVDPNAKTALAPSPGYTPVSGGVPGASSSEPLLSTPTTQPGDALVPAFVPTTLPTIAVGPSTQPVTFVPAPATQPVFGSPSGGGTPGSTDWSALLAGGSQSSGGSGGSAAGGSSAGGSAAGGSAGGVLPTGPSAGARPGPTPGSTLRPLLPSGGATGAGVMGSDSSSVGTSSYTVAKGDTLSGISAKVYGNANLWSKIVQANPGLNSSKLRVGQVIRIPAKDEVAPSDAAAPRLEGTGGSSLVRDPKSEYQVQSGDSLHKIAQRLYGNANRWEEIYNLNKATIGSSPTKLKVGQVLKLPAPPTTPATRP